MISAVPFGAFIEIGNSVYGPRHLSGLGSADPLQETPAVGQKVRVAFLDTGPAPGRVSLRLAKSPRTRRGRGPRSRVDRRRGHDPRLPEVLASSGPTTRLRATTSTTILAGGVRLAVAPIVTAL